LIRQADETDFPELRRLFARLDAVHHAWRPELFRSAEEIEREDLLLHAMVEQEGGLTLLFESGGRAVGMLHMVVRETEHTYLRAGRGAHVHHLVVTEDAEGTGVAQALMQAATEHARELGATRMELSVFECNDRARAFYAKLGFDTETRKLYRAL